MTNGKITICTEVEATQLLPYQAREAVQAAVGALAAGETDARVVLATAVATLPNSSSFGYEQIGVDLALQVIDALMTQAPDDAAATADAADTDTPASE